MLSKEEVIRYSRHLNLPDFDLEVQRRLADSKVLVVGAGGLGSPLLLYLSAAGIGHLGIIDFDQVELSNLQRQVLFSTSEIGQNKAAIASEKINELNPHVKVTVYTEKLTTDNAMDIIPQYDLVADGTDNFQTRYLVNDACVLAGKPNVYASVFRFEGQVSVFNALLENGERGPNYRDLYPRPPAPGLVPDCATGGVLGVLPGIVGSFQTLEVIKILTGIGSPLIGELLLIDTLSSNTRKIKFRKKDHSNITQLINYDEFCGVDQSKNDMAAIKEVTVQELKSWKEEGKDFQLIDVREQHEYDFVNIQGELIPLGDIMGRTEEISRDKDVVLMCRTGARSGTAVNALQQNGFNNLYNLKGGIVAWAKEIDTSLPTY